MNLQTILFKIKIARRGQQMVLFKMQGFHGSLEINPNLQSLLVSNNPFKAF